MKTRSKVILGIVVVLILGSAATLSALKGRDDGVEVRMEEVTRRDLTQTVTASGNIRARRAVDMSSDISAKVSRLMVEEGEEVTLGQVLMQLDPAQYRAGLSRSEASYSQARANESQQRSNLLQVQRNLDRLLALRERDEMLVSQQQIDDARTAVEVAEAALASAEFGVSQAQAGVDESTDRVSKTVIRAPIDGKVTRLNVEEGETVIIGTMNNPGSLILTISDLSVVEVVVQVDETDVPEIHLGDLAEVRIDAFPSRTFTGQVTEIGNSAIRPPSQQTAGQQAAIDFEVVITLDPTEVQLRPDLSATAEITTAVRRNALAVPIIALTVRDEDGGGDGEDADERADASAASGNEPADTEGVFVVRDGEAVFVPTVVGIAGREHFEVLSGLSEGDTIVAGPYQRIRALTNGDAVRRMGGDDASPPAGG